MAQQVKVLGVELGGDRVEPRRRRAVGLVEGEARRDLHRRKVLVPVRPRHRPLAVGRQPVGVQVGREERPAGRLLVGGERLGVRSRRPHPRPPRVVELAVVEHELGVCRMQPAQNGAPARPLCVLRLVALKVSVVEAVASGARLLGKVEHRLHDVLLELDRRQRRAERAVVFPQPRGAGAVGVRAVDDPRGQRRRIAGRLARSEGEDRVDVGDGLHALLAEVGEHLGERGGDRVDARQPRPRAHGFAEAEPQDLLPAPRIGRAIAGGDVGVPRREEHVVDPELRRAPDDALVLVASGRVRDVDLVVILGPPDVDLRRLLGRRRHKRRDHRRDRVALGLVDGGRRHRQRAPGAPREAQQRRIGDVGGAGHRRRPGEVGGVRHAQCVAREVGERVLDREDEARVVAVPPEERQLAAERRVDVDDVRGQVRNCRRRRA